MSTTQFIDELASGNASGAKDILNDMLSARAFEALEGRKVQIAQNIFNGSQVQEEEVELEEASTYKLGRAAAETKDFPIHHNGEHVGRLEFHTSAGKLHHRVSSVAGVPSEKFVRHPDREKMTNAHVAKHEAEARKHFAKKIKEEVEITQEEFDQLDELSKGTVRSYLKKSKEQESGALGRQGATTNNDMSPIDAGDKADEGKKRAIAKLGGSKSVLPSKVPAK